MYPIRSLCTAGRKRPQRMQAATLRRQEEVMDERATFGAWLQRRRKALDLSQAKLAEQVGCALGAIRKLEMEERRPSKQLAARLADHLHLAPEERALFLKAARAEVGMEQLGPPTRLTPLPTVATLPQGIYALKPASI